MCGCLLVSPTGDLAAIQACALTGNGTGDSLVHRLALSPLSHTSQGIILNSKEILGKFQGGTFRQLLN